MLDAGVTKGTAAKIIAARKEGPKAEPLHSGLILLLRDFRLWLLAESGVGAALEHGPVGLYLVIPVEAGISPSQPGIPAPSTALQELRDRKSTRLNSSH